jgi:hypothetical protein
MGLGVWRVLGGRFGCQFFLVLLRKRLVIEWAFEYNGGMELGDQQTPMDAVLDAFDTVLTGLINTVESGALDQLDAADKVAVWQRFETIRNKLPLIDHRLIADAEASQLAAEYCSSTINQFLTRVLQFSHGEAASRVRAAAAVGSAQVDGGGEAGACVAETRWPATRRHHLG